MRSARIRADSTCTAAHLLQHAVALPLFLSHEEGHAQNRRTFCIRPENPSADRSTPSANSQRSQAYLAFFTVRAPP
jgi:hypothetical protein